MKLTLPSAPGAELAARIRAYVTLVAELVVVNDVYSDVFARLRRRRTLSLAAEMHWELLPPLTFGTPPHCPPSRPLGLQDGKPVACETRLAPGDRLLLYTDGITEARSPDGEFFGEQRLADFISSALAAGDPAPETVRRLMRRVLTHQADQLQDDASVVVLEWATGQARRMQV
jgi:serine/threonine protein phosphatase PrpC